MTYAGALSNHQQQRRVGASNMSGSSGRQHCVDDVVGGDDEECDPDGVLSWQQSQLGKSLLFVGKCTGAEAKRWEQQRNDPAEVVTIATGRKIEHELFAVASTSTSRALGRWQQQLQLHAESLRKWQRGSISTLTWRRQRAKHTIAEKDWVRAFSGFARLCQERKLLEDTVMSMPAMVPSNTAGVGNGMSAAASPLTDLEDEDKDLIGGEEHYVGQVEIHWNGAGSAGSAAGDVVRTAKDAETYHARQYLRQHYRKHELVAGHSSVHALLRAENNESTLARHQAQPTDSPGRSSRQFPRNKEGPLLGGQLGIALSTGTTKAGPRAQ
jgi:hypothetical protein